MGSIQNVLAIDFETTGLDARQDGILEICAKVVAPDFSILDEMEVLVKQPQEVLDRMCPEVRAQHARSGLLAACAEEGKTPFAAWVMLAQFVHHHFPNGNAICMGNGIRLDREFIREQASEIEKSLSYQMIDVTSIQLAMRIFGRPHRAKRDVEKSIEGLREALAHIL